MDLTVFGVPLVALVVSALVGIAVGFLVNLTGRALVEWIVRQQWNRGAKRLYQENPGEFFSVLFNLPPWVKVAYQVVIFLSVVLGLLASIVTLVQFFGVHL